MRAGQRVLACFVAAAITLGAIYVVGRSGGAEAHDAADTNITTIVKRGDLFAPYGPHDDSYNGFKVFLSSPRHSDSGNRGECRNPGFQENVNGRQFGWWAGTGNWYGSNYDPELSLRNLHGRGYKVYLSKNTKDGGYLQNRNASRNWGSKVHIVTHTNATTGCDTGNSYLLTIWQNANDRRLANKLGSTLNPEVLSDWHNQQRNNLAELSTNASRGDVYVELQFHDNQFTQRWIHENSYRKGYLYGLALDGRFGYP